MYERSFCWCGPNLPICQWQTWPLKWPQCVYYFSDFWVIWLDHFDDLIKLVWMSVRPSVRPYVRPYVRTSVRPSVRPCVCQKNVPFYQDETMEIMLYSLGEKFSRTRFFVIEVMVKVIPSEKFGKITFQRLPLLSILTE